MARTIDEIPDDEAGTVTGAQLKEWKAQIEARAVEKARQQASNELPLEIREILGVDKSGARDPYAKLNLTKQQYQTLPFARLMRAMMTAGSDDPNRIESALKQMQSENNPLDDIVKRTLNESTMTAGGLFIKPEYSDIFTAALQAKSVVRQAGAVVVNMSQGNLTFQKEDTAIVETWHGENTSISASEPTFSEVTMSTKRVGVLVPVSQVLTSHASGMEARIADSALSRIASAQDAKFLRGDGTAYTPKGLKNWISTAAAYTFSSAGVTLTAMRADLNKMWQAILEANVDVDNARMAFVTSPLGWRLYNAITDGNGNAVFEAQLSQKMLQGAAFFRTSNIPANIGSGTQTEVYLADFNEFIIGEDNGLTVEYVRNANFLDSDGNQVNGLQKNVDAIKITQGIDSLFLRSTAGTLMTAFG